MSRSPADAVSRAVERSQQLLFPFNANKWFALGFTVFLAKCSEGGGGSFPNIPSGTGSGPSTGSGGSGGSGFGADVQHFFTEIAAALNRDLALYVTLAVLGTVFSLGVWAVIVWASSRAKLMLVESVIWDRVDVGGQWTRAAELGMSLTKFRLLLGGAGALLLFGTIAGGVAIALPDLQSGRFFGPRAMAGYGLGAGAIFLLGIPLSLAFALLDDFVVPLMVVRNVRVRAAWAMCRDEVLSGNLGGVALFYLLRIVLSFAIGVAMMVLTCVTCCLTAVPYIGTVLSLPVWVFHRAYPLYYMESLGIAVFPAPAPTWAAYDAWRFPR